MKTIIFLLAAVFFCNISIGQFSHVKLLIGYTSTEATHYLDSIMSLKRNPYYKVKEDVSNNGDLILSADFSLNDEEYYQCQNILLLFDRIDGVEICYKELIYGSNEYAQGNINYMKDNFAFVKTNTWEKTDLKSGVKIMAKFERRPGDNSKNYDITYFIEAE